MTAMAAGKPRPRLHIKTAGAAVAILATIFWAMALWIMLNFAGENTPSSTRVTPPSGATAALAAKASGNGGMATVNEAKNRGGGDDGTSSTSGPASVLDGKRILFAVASYNQTQVPYPMIAALRDVCEHGARVDIFVYSTLVWPVDVVDDVNAMTRRCRHPRGSVGVEVRLKSSEWGDHLVDFHRKLFYDNIDSYDLFVYTEDDQLIRSTNIAAYLDETEKVRRLVGPSRFADYSVGFMRFEVDGTAKPHQQKKLIFEHRWPDDIEVQFIRDDGLDGLYFTTPKLHHQGMFMATPEQLRSWKTRKPDCHFDTIEASKKYFHKIRASSVHLFRTNEKQFGCNVTQLLPIDSFDDLLIHHMSNKYWDSKHYVNHVVSASRLRAMLLEAQRGLKPETESKDYYGVRMFDDDKEKQLDTNLDEYLSYVKAHSKLKQGQVLIKPRR